MMTWTFELDIGDNLTFSDAYYSKVVDVNIMRGTRDFWSRVGVSNMARVRLANLGGDFYPSASGIQIGRFARLRAAFAGSTYTVFTGVIEAVNGGGRGTTMEVFLSGRLRMVGDEHVAMPLMESVDTLDILTEVLAVAPLRQALKDGSGNLYALVGEWELGTDVLGAAFTNYSFDTSLASYDFIGDNWGEAAISRVVSEAVSAEWGWLYESADAGIVFVNRRTIDLDTSAPLAFTEDDVGGNEVAQSDLINEIAIRLQSRSTEADALVWEAANAIRFPEGSTRNRVTFLNTDGRILGAGDLEYEIQVYDAQAGGDVVGRAGVEAFATGVEIVVENTGSGSWWVQAGAQIRGTARILGSPQEYIERDHSSINKYGRRSWQVPMPAFADTLDAFEVGKIGLLYSEPRMRLRSIRLKYIDPTQVNFELGRRVSVTLTEFGISGVYWVSGISHVGRPSNLTTTLYLRPASEVLYFIVGNEPQGRLGSYAVGW